MRLFSFGRKTDKPATIIKRIIDFIREDYQNHRQFKNSVDYIQHREWGLALDSLIELANESGDYFSEEFWNGLYVAADKMGLKEKGDYCREQIKRNKT